MATPETYIDVFDRLEGADARYIAISGVAVVPHGHSRPVADPDLVIDRAPEEADRVIGALMASGFTPSIPLPLSPLAVLRKFDSQSREVDVFARYHIPFEELWPASQMFGVGGSLVRVISPEHLIRSKQIIGRPHDLEDVEGLLAAANRVGGDRVAKP